MTGSKVGKVSSFLKSGVIEDVIRRRVWTINDILNAEEITESIVDTLISDMDNSIKWEILRQSDLAKDMSEHLRKELNNMVSFVLTNFLMEELLLFTTKESLVNPQIGNT